MKDEVRERWREYFKELIGNDGEEVSFGRVGLEVRRETNGHVREEEITKEEEKRTVKLLKIRKA